MPYGYTGKIIRVDLSKNSYWVDHLEEETYRKYLGGGGLGGHYVAKHVPPGTDAFDPQNMLVFATSPVTGTPVPGFGRHSVVSISPLTGGICDSEAGGFWGAELKFAGYDAVVVQGRAEKPVYIYISDDQVSVEEADDIWGGFLKEARYYLQDKNSGRLPKILGIGPGGENLVNYACITSDLRDVNGRGGLGAVMGSKNLKAIAVSSQNRKISMKEVAPVKEVAKKFNATYSEFGHNKLLRALGTLGLINPQNKTGQLPTYNFKSGVFSEAQNLSGETLRDTIRYKMVGCHACSIKCKALVNSESPYSIDPDYTIAEYESVSALGTYTGVDDLSVVCKAVELCNKYTIDTISAGAAISFAMECYEKGLIDSQDVGGMDLSFGNKEAILPLVEMIARREGIGDLLADGVKRASEKIGKEASEFAMHCKGMEFPAHEPRVKKSMALTYGLSPIGADHMASEQDHAIAPGAPQVHFDRLATLDWRGALDMDDLGDQKVRFNYLTQILYSSYNCLDLCMFCAPPRRALGFDDLIKVMNAVTGWETSLWEILKAGERRINLFRFYNGKAGFTHEDDMLPDRVFEPLEGGVSDGKYVDREIYRHAVKQFYQMAGWDENGVPLEGKLKELDLIWLKDYL